MKILYLRLDNFAMIKSAMKRKSIEIDFSNSKNRIVLLIGDNGSGKTSILMHLQPFANTGNGDIRNGSDQIVKDQGGNPENGYKEIHIQKEDDLYKIKHHYLYKSNKGLKSFIEKNGVELNPNGNVSSFIEYVEDELGIVPNYLKLLRLGPNVKTFMGMKASERKEYAGELLSDIDMYQKYFKKVNSDSRVIKSLLKSVVERIDKLKIYNQDDEFKKKENLISSLAIKKERHDSINSEIGSINGKISYICPNGEDSLRIVYGELISKEKSLRDKLTKLSNKKRKTFILFLGGIQNTKDTLNSEINDLTNKISVNKGLMDFHFKNLQIQYDMKSQKEEGLKFISSDKQLNEIETHIENLKRERGLLSKRFKGATISVTREEMMQSLAILQEIDKLVNDIYEFNQETVDYVLQYYQSGKNIIGQSKKKINEIDEKIRRLELKLGAIKMGAGKTENKVYILYKPKDCLACECPYYNFYSDIMDSKKSDSSTFTSELKELERIRDEIISVPDIVNKLDCIKTIINANKPLIKKLPNNYLDLKRILVAIKNITPIYDEEEITSFINVLEDYENFLSLDKVIKDSEETRSLMVKNKGSIVDIQKEISEICIEISKCEGEIDNLRKDNSIFEDKISELNSRLESVLEFESIVEKESALTKELDDTVREIQTVKETTAKVLELVNIKKELLSNKEILQNDIKEIEEEIKNIEFKLIEFNKLNEEKKTIEEKYDDIELLKLALSSTKGIPLLFIQLYFKNTQMVINQLLDTVYGGSLELDRFNINEKEFKIPYIKNGIWVDDIAKSSQGEETFISMALSFSIINQSIKDYNILLLDEIDGPLDMKRRIEFLKILEYQLDIINAEQVFLITHNDVFDNYPVDVILTSDKDIDNYKNINIIFGGVA